jgi:hypothetical protein
MRESIDLEFTVSVVADGSVGPKADAIIESLLEGFPWVTGALLEAVVRYEEVAP